MSSASIAMPLSSSSSAKTATHLLRTPFLAPLLPPPSKSSLAAAASVRTRRLRVAAFLKDRAVAGLTSAAMTASMVVPAVAEAAGSDITPSLKNFLLSIVAGGVVAAVIIGAVIGVSNFDPVKRG